MKVLHSGAILRSSPGIARQMHWEQQAADELGIDWTTRLFGPVPEEHLAISAGAGQQNLLQGRSLRNWITLRIRYNLWLWRQRKNFDLLFLRYSIHDPFQFLFVLVSGHKVVLVHHAIELAEISGLPGFGNRIRYLLECLLGKLSVSLAYGTVGVTTEILEYELHRSIRKKIAFAEYPNAIKLPVPIVEDARGDIPTFLFVASEFEPWQGLDLLVDSAALSHDNFQVHLVGVIPPNLKARVAADSRFVVHGSLLTDEIRELASQSWLGLSSMALWRQGLSQACALKVRDYLGWGLPAAGNYRETFSNEFPFYAVVEVEIQQLLEVAESLRHATRREVATSASRYISKTATLHNLYTIFGDSYLEPSPKSKSREGKIK
jgi:hypothetical protein